MLACCLLVGAISEPVLKLLRQSSKLLQGDVAIKTMVEGASTGAKTLNSTLNVSIKTYSLEAKFI
jgi:hypothetical protein